MPNIIDRVTNFISQQAMPPPGSTVVLALSGGLDSVALLLILQELKYKLTIAHCNFGLRDEALEDEAWVRALARQHGIPLYVRRFTAADFAHYAGEGTQQAARKLRYAFFEEVMAAQSIAFCATAHHADDQLETQVMSFFRGSGRELLHSIPAVRGAYFRPLLPIRKHELQDWLQARGQDWRHDRSNDKDAYQRNLVRNQLLPLLEQLQPNFREHFAAQAERHAAQMTLLDQTMEAMLPAVVVIEGNESKLDWEACMGQWGATQAMVFVEWWLDRQGFWAGQITELMKLLQSATGARMQFGRQEVLRDRQWLILRQISDAPSMEVMTLNFDLEQIWQWDYAGESLQSRPVPKPKQFDGALGIESHWLDPQKLILPLRIRPWQKGDRYQPLGLRGTKLISDILIDQKRNQWEKDQAWVIEDAEGIILLSGYRIAQRVALTTESSQCIQITRLNATRSASQGH